MMNKTRSLLTAITLLAALPCVVWAQTLVVKPNNPIADIQPTMYGVFFEDINFAADGGIYAEMVKNRSFEFYKPLMGWSLVKKNDADGSVLIQNREESQSANPRYASIQINGVGMAIINEGFRGMGIKQGLDYHFSVRARQNAGSSVAITVELRTATGESIGKTSLTPQGTQWKKYTATLKATQTEAKGNLAVTFSGNGTMDVAVGYSAGAPSRFSGDGAGGFATPVAISSTSLNVTSMDAAKVDGDADTDLVLGTTAGMYLIYNPLIIIDLKI